jgi:hypothetical protein
MNARELRIGNLVIWNGDPEETGLICPIDGEDIDKMERSEAYSKEHLPIPLTEMWLNKFEWERVKAYEFVFLNNNYFSIDSSGRLYYMDDYTAVDIQYVHQLQNLYFALTGEELIIK